MVAATAQAGYISPMTALASHALNGMANSVVPPTSGKNLRTKNKFYQSVYICMFQHSDLKKQYGKIS